MSLQNEIDKNRAEIRSDGYSMSIGEIVSLYENNELDIHPEFQRFFRWTPFQKSRLIESIFLGIPIPQIFVAQKEDGVWDVVDGLQRLATIFQVIGVLRDENNNILPPLILESTNYLPSLANKKWEDADAKISLTQTQRLLIKRSKLDIRIILRESTESTKYELFQRLNTGGSPLSDQEVRNSILVMMDKEYFRWMRQLAQAEDFKECLSLTDRALEEQYDMELLVRFIIFRKMPMEELKTIGDVGDFLTNKIINVVENKTLNLEREASAFITTFEILRQTLGADSFRKYDSTKNTFTGGFLVSAFEIVALGIGFNFEKVAREKDHILAAVKSLWQDPKYISQSGSGIRASTRMPITIRLGRQAFHQ